MNSLREGDDGKVLTESRPIRVVVCDDHQVVAEGVAALLGFEPDIEVLGIAGSAAELMALIQGRGVDVVLIDYDLPDINGVEATKTLKQQDSAMKVVMFTSYANDDVLTAAMDSGCSGFITKHDGVQQLLGGVRLAAAGESVVSAAVPDQLLPLVNPETEAASSGLTSRELEVLELLAQGASTRTIAERLVLSNATVRNHIQSILVKLDSHSRLEAVTTAVRQGVIRRS